MKLGKEAQRDVHDHMPSIGLYGIWPISMCDRIKIISREPRQGKEGRWEQAKLKEAVLRLPFPASAAGTDPPLRC
jgi:hypothetical protein